MDTALFNDPVFRNFASERPIAVAAQLVLRRLLDPETIDQLFTEHAVEQYERSLLFSSLTSLVSAVVLGKQASINAGYKKMRDKFDVSLYAVYQKLQRVEPRTIQELVRHSYRQTVDVRQEFGGVARHDLSGYATRILDGNHLSGTEHRLKETRTTTAAPLPGKSLVVYDPRYDAVADIFPIEDGHAQERSALDQVIETLRAKQLWIADRNFCTLMFMYSIAIKCGVFVIRHHSQLHGIEQGKLRKIGESDTGVIYENRLQLPTFDGKTITVRRVVVHLFEATRDGDTEVVLLTNLPAEDADAIAVSNLYRTRWKIETAFGHMTLAMNCEIKPLCYPRAALFCFANALVAYNALSIVKGMIAIEHGRDAGESMSHYYMALEICETTDGMLIALPEARWSEVHAMPVSIFASELRTISKSIRLATYRKSVRGPKKTPPKKNNNKRSVHVSTAKILAERKQK